MNRCCSIALGVGLTAASAVAAQVQRPPCGLTSPEAEHHGHLVSPAAAEHNSEPAHPAVTLPAELARLLEERARHWNDRDGLLPLYTADAWVVTEDNWLRGREAVAEHLAGLFAKPHQVTPLAYGVQGSSAWVAGYFSRPDGERTRVFGKVLLALARGEDGAWRIAAESPTFPGVYRSAPIDGAQLVAQLDDAGAKRAAVLSVAYWFGSAWQAAPVDEAGRVRAENEWVAKEVARFPERLVGLCSFNPLRPYALAELERCAAEPAFRGVKLHFGNSAVDLRRPEHLERLREVFRAADRHGLAIVAHLWTGPEYEEEGGAHARLFLEQLLPAAPRVPIQIAHMAGGGRSTPAAMTVFADAIAAGDPRTGKLWFDVATLTGGQSAEGLAADAATMRRIGLDRIVFGTDASPPGPPLLEAWNTFRVRMPLTDAELATIACNVAPYLR